MECRVWGNGQHLDSPLRGRPTLAVLQWHDGHMLKGNKKANSQQTPNILNPSLQLLDCETTRLKTISLSPYKEKSISRCLTIFKKD